MSEIMHQAHKFLQNFCRGNDQNQILLHRNLKVLLHSGNPVSLLLIMFQIHHSSLSPIQTVEVVTLTEVFRDNGALCNKVQESEIQYFIHCIEKKGRDIRYLKFLQTIMKVNGQPIKRSQDLVMAEVQSLMC